MSAEILTRSHRYGEVIKLEHIFLLRLAAVLALAILGLLAFAKLEYGWGTLHLDIGSDNQGGLNRLEKLITLDYRWA